VLLNQGDQVQKSGKGHHRPLALVQAGAPSHIEHPLGQGKLGLVAELHHYISISMCPQEANDPDLLAIQRVMAVAHSRIP